MTITTTRTDCTRDNVAVHLPNASTLGFGRYNFKTAREITMNWNAGPGANNATYLVTIPANTRCVAADRGQFFVDDLSWIKDRKSMLYHDASYRGIRLTPFDLA